MNIPYEMPLLDSVLSALAHQKRRAIIHDLSLSPATIGQLARDHDLSLPAIHKHVRCLEDAKLIIRRKAGRSNYLALDHTNVRLVQSWIMQFHTNWGSPNASLENYIARMQE